MAFQRSIQLNPSYALVRLFYSFYLEAMGRLDEAILEAEQARALDPLSLQANLNLGWQYLRAGCLERAQLVFQSTAELNPDFWGVHWGLGHYYRQRLIPLAPVGSTGGGLDATRAAARPG